MNRIVAIGIGVFLFAGILVWATMESTKPKPGGELSSLGQDHVTDIYGLQYNSNPPTSGPHFPVWAKRGTYPYQISDGHLIHSLEHGYIVLSYNCSKKVSKGEGVSNVSKATQNLFGFVAFAHEGETKDATDSGTPLMHLTLPETLGGFTPDKDMPKDEAPLPKDFATGECIAFVKDLSQFLDVAQRVIIVPRPTLDTRLALTAWQHIEKFNPKFPTKLSQEEIERAKNFINAYHNKGPEATME